MQKKLIAAAVAGALATPVAIADVAVSGSSRSGVEYTGTNWAVSDNYSRLRFKASSDLGNGQSAFMNYEFRVKSDKGAIHDGDTQRLSYVGIKGDWGSLSMGAQWSTLFNVVGTFIDKSNRYGGLGYWGGGGGQYRMADSVYVSTSLGGMSLSGDLQMNDDGDGDDLDRATIGANLGIGGVSIGAAWQDNGNADFTGVGASISLAGVGLSGGYTDTNGAGSGFGVNANLAGIVVAYEEHDGTADGTIWGHYGIGLGGGAKAIIELMNDGTNTKGMGMLRMDF